MIKRCLLTGLSAVILGASSFICADETEIVLKNNSTASGFSIKEEVGNTTIARFGGDGNVGIGTTDPVRQFNVQENSGGQVTIGIFNTDAGVTNNDGLHLGINSSENAFLEFKETGNLVIDNSVGGNVILQETAGNVGIGTTAPTEKLEVTGGIKVTGTVPDPPSANTLYKDNIIKAWVNFNGTGAVAIRDSFNVSSITDRGEGTYTVIWNRDFANKNYCTVGTSGATTGTYLFFSNEGGYTVSSVDITLTKPEGNKDEAIVCLMAIGDQ